MAISTTAGARWFIGPVLNPDTVNAMTEAEAITFFEAIIEGDWEEVSEVEDLGDHGDSAEEITFTAIANRRVRKLKGPRDAGTKTIVCGRDPLDAGQLAMKAAEETDFNYAFRVIYSDAPDDAHSNSIDYMGGMVLTNPVNQGNVSNVTRITFDVGINTAIYEVPSALLPT